MVDNEGRWGMSRHIDFLNRALMRVCLGAVSAHHGGGPEMYRERRIVISEPPGHAKPLAEGTMVLMGNGTYRRLDEVEVGDWVVTHKGLPRKVMAVHEQGQLPVLRIRTELGREVVAALSHPFFTADGWKRADELKIGDGLAVVERPEVTDTSGRSVEEFKMLGYLVGDGQVTIQRKCHKGPFGMQAAVFTNQDERIIEDFKRCASRIGFETREDGRTATGTARIRLVNGGCVWVRGSGISGQNSHTKRIPDWVYRGSKEKIAAFVAAYFDCDGTVTKRGMARKDCCAEFCSINRNLLKDVQRLFVRLGVRTRLAKKPTSFRGRRIEAWRLTVTSLSDAADFWKAVPLVGRKKDRMDEWAPVRSVFKGEFSSDRVVFVEPAGEEKCRCLTVHEYETFTAEDLVVHNSEYGSKYLPAWFLGMFPDKRVLLASYEAGQALKWGRATQDVLRKHEDKFGVKIREDVKAAYKWETQHGGGMVTAGIGGPVTGKRAELVIIDDAVKNLDQAYSPTYRERCIDWFNSVVYTRAEPGCAFVVIGTRWHPEDLIGKLLALGEWPHICLPAIAEENDQLGRSPGEALWPERHPIEELLYTKRQIGNRLFEALYQQHPTPEGGAIFSPGKMSWYIDLADGWKFPDGVVWPHTHCTRFAVIDPSVGKKTESDPTAVGIFATTPDDRLLVLETVSERVKLEGLVPHIKRLCQKWGVEYACVEANGFQAEIVRQARNVMSDVCPIREVHPHGKSKVVRSMQAVVLMDNGQVYVPKEGADRPSWVEPFVAELRNWSGDDRELDNCVDVLAYSARQMITGRNILPTTQIISDLDRARPNEREVGESGFGGWKRRSRLDPFGDRESVRSRVFGF